MNAVELTDLTKHYGDFTLDRVSLSLPEGCVMGLVGENGGGKTTLIKLLLGMLRKDGGTVRVLAAIWIQTAAPSRKNWAWCWTRQVFPSASPRGRRAGSWPLPTRTGTRAPTMRTCKSSPCRRISPSRTFPAA